MAGQVASIPQGPLRSLKWSMLGRNGEYKKTVRCYQGVKKHKKTIWSLNRKHIF